MVDVPQAPAPSAWHAHLDSFDLHAGLRIRAKARDRLERLCRYALRPSVGRTRLQLMPDGTVVLELHRALMQRGFGFDVLTCGRCQGRLRLVALISAPAVIDRILRHIGVSTTRVAPRPSRAPPHRDATMDLHLLAD